MRNNITITDDDRGLEFDLSVISHVVPGVRATRYEPGEASSISIDNVRVYEAWVRCGDVRCPLLKTDAIGEWVRETYREEILEEIHAAKDAH